MPKSTITSKNQTTVPREIRERLGVGPKDVLEWEVRDGEVRITPATRAFLGRRGTIRAGRGSVVEDVRRARRERGRGR